MIHVYMLGRFSVQLDNQPQRGFEIGKVQELFCYLLLHLKKPSYREHLASLMWHNTTTAQSRRYLSKTVWQLQNALADCSLQDLPLLTIDPDWIQVNSHCDFWIDIAVLEHASEITSNVRGHQLGKSQIEHVRHAVSLYHSELLEGWYQDWCIIERERMQHIFLSLVDKLMEYCEYKRQFELGIHYGRHILRYDKTRERTHRRLMRMLHLDGDRTGALRQYGLCNEALRDELSVSPSHQTQRLFRLIKADVLDREIEPKLGSNVFGRLRCLQSRLLDIQQQIQGEIDAVDTLLRRND